MRKNKSKFSNTTKEQLIEELKEQIKKYEEENKFNRYDKIITRDYYHVNSKYGTAYRRLFSSFDEFLALAIGKDDIRAFELEKKLLKLQNENAELLSDKNKLLKNAVEEDNILDLYKEKLIDIKIPKPFKLTPIKNDSKKEAILMLSDFHASEIVNKEEVAGTNEYNFEIMKKRLDRVFHYFVYYCDMFKIRKVCLAFLGDIFSGTHHEELKRNNEENEVDILFMVNEYLSQKLLEIESYFAQIDCEFLVGNHSRIPEGKPQFKNAPILNYEYILAKQMELQYELIQKNVKQKKINIHSHRCLFKVIEVAGRRFFLTHGNALTNGSNSFAGIPYYGLSMSGGKLYGYLTAADNAIAENDFSDILMAHLHCSSRVKIPSGNLYINGSVIGTGEFSLFKMKSISEPEQTMLVVQKGKVTNELTLRGEDY